MTIGVLGLQGCCRPHEQMFAALGVPTLRVLYARQLAEVHGLVIPGGESTTMLLLARKEGMWEALQEFGRTRPVWGVCAGCILMAHQVTHPAQLSLDLLDIDVMRNAYGAQNESFVASLPIAFAGDPVELPAIFIRAPRIDRVGAGRIVRARHGQEPVFVDSDRHMVTTFHPELTESTAVHQHFLGKVGG